MKGKNLTFSLAEKFIYSPGQRTSQSTKTNFLKMEKNNDCFLFENFGQFINLLLLKLFSSKPILFGVYF